MASIEIEVSLYEDLFRSAEAAADRLSISRSQLYAMALDEFLARHSEADVPERLNQLYSSQHAEVDVSLQSAQPHPLNQDSW